MWPTSSNVCLSREPWKRSIRTRSATSSSLVTTAPPSPKAPRFLDGKNENVAAVPSAPGRPSDALRAGGLRGVLQHRHAERLDLRHRSDVAEQVDDHHRLRARRQRRAHGLGGDAERLGVDVAEHRARAGRRDRLGGRVERERRDHDLVAGADAERAQRERQRVGPVRDADRVAGADIGGELVLERLTSGPRMKLLASIIAASFASISPRSGATGVRVSKRGTDIGRGYTLASASSGGDLRWRSTDSF